MLRRAVMDAPPLTLCAKCFKSLGSHYVTCHICKSRFHLLCSKMDDKCVEILKNNVNIVFNCNDCLSASSDMISLISSISLELRELKQSIVSSLCEDVQGLKDEVNKLTKNNETVKNIQNKSKDKPNINIENKNKSNKINTNNVTLRSKTDFVSGTSNLYNSQCFENASSITSHEAASYVGSNLFDAEIENNQWTQVRRRKRRNRIVAVGDNDNNDLDVVVKKKFLHVSSFKPSVTSEQIISYIEKHTDIDKHHLECTRLVKKGTDETTLKHVNFKVGVSPSFYNELIKPSLWPLNTKIRPFVFFFKNKQWSCQTPYRC